MTFKKSYVPGILGSVLTLTVIMAAPVKAETKEETILNKTDWSTMAAANVEGYVNIRSEANADSEIVGVLMPGYAVTVTEKGDEWSKISSNGVEGYIKNEYLVFGEEAKAHYRNMCGITGVVQADSLRVREAASTDSAQVGTLTQNGEVSIFGEEADWYQIQYSGISNRLGFILALIARLTTMGSISATVPVLLTNAPIAEVTNITRKNRRISLFPASLRIRELIIFASPV